MYAVIKTGGKQYAVRENETIEVEKLDAAVGDEVAITDVLLVTGDHGQIVGTPNVVGASVKGKVLAHGRGKKIVGHTYKPKKNIHRRFGHRQAFTKILIEKISY